MSSKDLSKKMCDLKTRFLFSASSLEARCSPRKKQHSLEYHRVHPSITGDLWHEKVLLEV